MRRLPLLAATALLMGACSSSGGDDRSDDGTPDRNVSSASPSSSGPPASPSATGPDCNDVWKAGKTLPADYEGCLADGRPGSQETYACNDGTTLVAFQDSFYGVTGGKIVRPELSPMQDTEQYGAVFRACTGD
ncbi:MAG: hypothetical protein JWP31_433 [Aeromicrobium sp.]|nr:hypothetical protein [Aeromicrobium sp.]